MLNIIFSSKHYSHDWNGQATILKNSLSRIRLNSFSKYAIKPCFIRIYFRHRIAGGARLDLGLKIDRTVGFIRNGNSMVVGFDTGPNFGSMHPYAGWTLLSVLCWGERVKLIHISYGSSLAGKHPHWNLAGSCKFPFDRLIVQSQVGKSMSPETNYRGICVNYGVKGILRLFWKLTWEEVWVWSFGSPNHLEKWEASHRRSTPRTQNSPKNRLKGRSLGNGIV